ncbi:hypothetical protein [uncultured Clostridium sp.]|jgi:predicted transcriptional regulator|uniref:hypothetical protein n=1 Tax=uncultured Clostridium sp. TaxID=59620 RepID=UPI002614E2BD|nr:hypothetical protein [uncultured Clostridium sp.]
MKLNNVDVLCIKIEVKTNKEGGNYLLIDLLDIVSGDNFNIMSKNIDFMSELKAMTKYKVTLNLTSNRYGLKLDLESINEELGSI